MKKLIFLIIVVAALSYATWYRIDKDSNKQIAQGVDKIQQEKGIPVRTVDVKRQDVLQIITVSGQITPSYDSTISSMVGERVSEVNCKTGQKVSKGDVLVTLDSKTAKLQVLQAKAARQVAEQELQKLKNGSRPEEILAAQADLENAKAQHRIAEIEYNRQKKLYKEEATTLQIFQDAETSFNRAKALVKAVQAQYEIVKKGPREEDIALAQANLELAKVAVLQAEDNLGHHLIKAAFDGVVTKRLVDPGDIADFNMALFELMNIDKVYLELPVSELYISRVGIKKNIKFRADAYPEKLFDGMVAEINPQADETDRTFMVRIIIPNKEHVLKPGMFARAELVINEAKNALVIPEAAINLDIEGKFVWVAEAGEVEITEMPELKEGQDPKELEPVTRTIDAIVAKRKGVTTGIRSGDIIEVKSGLNVSEKIIEMGALLKENAMVIIDTEAQSNQTMENDIEG